MCSTIFQHLILKETQINVIYITVGVTECTEITIIHSRYNRQTERPKKNSHTDLPFQVFLPMIAKLYILLPFGKMNGQFLHLEAQHSPQTVTFFHQ